MRVNNFQFPIGFSQFNEGSDLKLELPFFQFPIGFSQDQWGWYLDYI